MACDIARGRSFGFMPFCHYSLDRASIFSSYVGGPSSLIEGILADEELEAFPAQLDDPYDGPPQRMSGGPPV